MIPVSSFSGDCSLPSTSLFLLFRGFLVSVALFYFFGFRKWFICLGLSIRGLNFVLGLTFVVLCKVHLNQYIVVRQNFLEPFHLVMLIFDSFHMVFEFHYFFFHHFYEFLLSCAHVHDLHFLFRFVVRSNLNFLPYHMVGNGDINFVTPLS